MSKFSIESFFSKTAQQDKGSGFFELESDKILELNLEEGTSDSVWIKMGKMVAYRGAVTFKREGIMEQGLSRLVKKTFTGEGVTLMKASGNGKVYVADFAKKVSIIDLTDDSIYVNGNDLLAMAPSLTWDIKMMKKVSSMMAGGLFNIEVKGSGLLAITSHGDPLTLMVTPGNPVYTDPNATIAWSSGLNPTFKTDMSIGTLFGRGSGESIQMAFEGEGFVVVQPYEESYAVE